MHVTSLRKESGMAANVADAIRLFAEREYIQSARRRGLNRVQIRVGDVHKALKLKNRVPNVSSALRSRIFLEKNHLEIEEESGPPSGMGTRTTFTYRLLHEKEPHIATAQGAGFERLRGLLKEALDSLGGGEAFLRRERNRFYDSDVSEEK
jgi:hypothetical protein